MSELKNGVELTLSLALSLDLLEQYNCKQSLKNQVSKAKTAILEKLIDDNYTEMYKKNEEYTQNLISYKEKLITKIAKYNEPDFVLFSSFCEHFDKNIHLARKKGVIFFDKIL